MKDRSYEVRWLSPDVEIVPIVVTIGAALDPDGETLWNDARELSRHIFDNNMLDVAEITPQRISVRVISYRAFHVDRARGNKRIKPLAVSGYVLSGSRILVGRRPAEVQQYPGCWESIPSGAIEMAPDGTINAQRSLLGEVSEEMGIAADAASVGEPMLVYDPGAATFDLCFGLKLAYQDDEIVNKTRGAGHYADVDFVSIGDVARLQGTVPTTRALAKYLITARDRSAAGSGA